MIFSAIRNKYSGLSLIASFMLVLVSVSGLLGCGSSSSDNKADPKGYYTGTAAVKDGSNADIVISDLQGMISDNRFMFMSVANTLLYDGTITSVTDNDFIANVTIYESDYAANNNDGSVTVTTTTVTGIITEGSQITGTFEGANAWSGTFILVYDQSNNEVSSLAKVETAISNVWSGYIGEFGNQKFTINATGNIINYDEAGTGAFGGCTITESSITPIPDTRLYSVIFKFLPTCPEGTFTGFATTKGTDNVLVLAYADGTLAASADYNLITVP